MGFTWDEYCRAPNTEYDSCSQRFRTTFAHQRANVERVITAVRPQTVVCLGAGVLNDIPYAKLLASGSTLHLVDWLPEVIDTGLRNSIIRKDEAGSISCLYCTPDLECPEEYCRNYCPVAGRGRGVCDHFELQGDDPSHCAAFEKGELPATYCEDVTGGYALTFARAIPPALDKISSWNRIVQRALSLARKAPQSRDRLSIATASADLVTSSMVISQFEHEPFDFFSRAAVRALGRPSSREERSLRDKLDALTSTLTANQVEHHCREIKRILAPGGKCYMSFEVFQHHATRDFWFLVRRVHDSLASVGNHFHFNFDIITAQECVDRFDTDGHPSIVFSFVLEPKPSAPS